MANTFDDFVNRENQMATNPIDWDKELKEWLDYLDQFKDSIADYLSEYIDQNKVTLEFVTKRIDEQEIGSYEVDIITIIIGNTRVRLEPIGTLLIGAKGRVDMRGPKGTVKFVLVPKDATGASIRVQVVSGDAKKKETKENETIEWVWKISTPPPRIAYTELQKESFLTAIMEVVNG